MYTRNEIEEVIATLESVGWKVIEKHIEETIATYTGQLVESNDTEDEKLKGKIQALSRDVLNLKEEFKSMLEAKIKEEAAK